MFYSQLLAFINSNPAGVHVNRVILRVDEPTREARGQPLWQAGPESVLYTNFLSLLPLHVDVKIYPYLDEWSSATWKHAMGTGTALEAVFKYTSEWNDLLSALRPGLRISGIVTDWEESTMEEGGDFNTHMHLIPYYKAMYGEYLTVGTSIGYDCTHWIGRDVFRHVDEFYMQMYDWYVEKTSPLDNIAAGDAEYVNQPEKLLATLKGLNVLKPELFASEKFHLMWSVQRADRDLGGSTCRYPLTYMDKVTKIPYQQCGNSNQFGTWQPAQFHAFLNLLKIQHPEFASKSHGIYEFALLPFTWLPASDYVLPACGAGARAYPCPPVGYDTGAYRTVSLITPSAPQIGAGDLISFIPSAPAVGTGSGNVPSGIDQYFALDTNPDGYFLWVDWPHQVNADPEMWPGFFAQLLAFIDSNAAGVHINRVILRVVDPSREAGHILLWQVDPESILYRHFFSRLPLHVDVKIHPQLNEYSSEAWRTHMGTETALEAVFMYTSEWRGLLEAMRPGVRVSGIVTDWRETTMTGGGDFGQHVDRIPELKATFGPDLTFGTVLRFDCTACIRRVEFEHVDEFYMQMFGWYIEDTTPVVQLNVGDAEYANDEAKLLATLQSWGMLKPKDFASTKFHFMWSVQSADKYICRYPPSGTTSANQFGTWAPARFHAFINLLKANHLEFAYPKSHGIYEFAFIPNTWI